MVSFPLGFFFRSVAGLDEEVENDMLVVVSRFTRWSG